MSQAKMPVAEAVAGEQLLGKYHNIQSTGATIPALGTDTECVTQAVQELQKRDPAFIQRTDYYAVLDGCLGGILGLMSMVVDFVMTLEAECVATSHNSIDRVFFEHGPSGIEAMRYCDQQELVRAWGTLTDSSGQTHAYEAMRCHANTRMGRRIIVHHTWKRTHLWAYYLDTKKLESVVVQNYVLGAPQRWHNTPQQQNKQRCQMLLRFRQLDSVESDATIEPRLLEFDYVDCDDEEDWPLENKCAKAVLREEITYRQAWTRCNGTDNSEPIVYPVGWHNPNVSPVDKQTIVDALRHYKQRALTGQLLDDSTALLEYVLPQMCARDLPPLDVLRRECLQNGALQWHIKRESDTHISMSLSFGHEWTYHARESIDLVWHHKYASWFITHTRSRGMRDRPDDWVHSELFQDDEQDSVLVAGRVPLPVEWFGRSPDWLHQHLGAQSNLKRVSDYGCHTIWPRYFYRPVLQRNHLHPLTQWIEEHDNASVEEQNAFRQHVQSLRRNMPVAFFVLETEPRTVRWRNIFSDDSLRPSWHALEWCWNLLPSKVTRGANQKETRTFIRAVEHSKRELRSLWPGLWQNEPMELNALADFPDDTLASLVHTDDADLFVTQNAHESYIRSGGRHIFGNHANRWCLDDLTPCSHIGFTNSTGIRGQSRTFSSLGARDNSDNTSIALQHCQDTISGPQVFRVAWTLKSCASRVHLVVITTAETIHIECKPAPVVEYLTKQVAAFLHIWAVLTQIVYSTSLEALVLEAGAEWLSQTLFGQSTALPTSVVDEQLEFELKAHVPLMLSTDDLWRRYNKWEIDRLQYKTDEPTAQFVNTSWYLEAHATWKLLLDALSQSKRGVATGKSARLLPPPEPEECDEYEFDLESNFLHETTMTYEPSRRRVFSGSSYRLLPDVYTISGKNGWCAVSEEVVGRKQWKQTYQFFSNDESLPTSTLPPVDDSPEEEDVKSDVASAPLVPVTTLGNTGSRSTHNNPPRAQQQQPAAQRGEAASWSQFDQKSGRRMLEASIDRNQSLRVKLGDKQQRWLLNPTIYKAGSYVERDSEGRALTRRLPCRIRFELNKDSQVVSEQRVDKVRASQGTPTEICKVHVDFKNETFYCSEELVGTNCPVCLDHTADCFGVVAPHWPHRCMHKLCVGCITHLSRLGAGAFLCPQCRAPFTGHKRIVVLDENVKHIHRVEEAQSIFWNTKFTYRVGQKLVIADWRVDNVRACGRGVHGFLDSRDPGMMPYWGMLLDPANVDPPKPEVRVTAPPPLPLENLVAPVPVAQVHVVAAAALTPEQEEELQAAIQAGVLPGAPAP